MSILAFQNLRLRILQTFCIFSIVAGSQAADVATESSRPTVFSITHVATSLGTSIYITNANPSLEAANLFSLAPGETVVSPPAIVERAPNLTRVIMISSMLGENGGTIMKTNIQAFYGNANPGKGLLPGVDRLNYPPEVISQSADWKVVADVAQYFQADGSAVTKTNGWVEFSSKEALERAKAVPTTVLERSHHHKVVERTHFEEDDEGRVRAKHSSYIELETGGSYVDENGQWQDAVPHFEIENGVAVARRTAHKVVLAADINGNNPVQIVLPNGVILRSRVLGLGYLDRKTGGTVILAEPKPTEGELSPAGDEVLYRGAFNNIDADVRYVLTKAGIEQDIILNEAVPAPEEFGIEGAVAQLEVITEFFPTVEPQITERIARQELDPQKRAAMAEPDVIDHLVDFGGMRIAYGQAFGSWEEERPVKAHRAVPMTKRWLKLEGRHILFEAVEHPQIKPFLDKLPPRANRPQASIMRSGTRALPQPETAAISPPKEIQVAAGPFPRTGVVLDYLLSASEENKSFYAKTYLVKGLVHLTGNTVIHGGAVIKFAHGSTVDARIKVTGNLATQTSSQKAYFVGINDNSVGEEIVPGTPSGVYGSTTHLEPV